MDEKKLAEQIGLPVAALPDLLGAGGLACYIATKYVQRHSIGAAVR